MHQRAPKTCVHHRRFAPVGQAASLAAGPRYIVRATLRASHRCPRRLDVDAWAAKSVSNCATNSGWSAGPPGHGRATELAPVRATMAGRLVCAGDRVFASASSWRTVSDGAAMPGSARLMPATVPGHGGGAGTRRGRARGTPCSALPSRGIAPRDRPDRPRSWGPADPRPTGRRPTTAGSQALLGGKVRHLPARAPACDRSPDAAGRAIPPRISVDDGEVAVVLAAWCGEHGAGERRDSRDRSHGLCITIGLHDLR